MAHLATRSDQVDGTASRYARWTQANQRKEPEIKLLQQGAMPMTKKRHGAKKKVK